MVRSAPLAALLLLILGASPALAQTVPAAAVPAPAGTGAPAAADPYSWLEDVHGTRATSWVNDENAKTLKVLQGDSRFDTFDRQAQAIGNATDRIPAPSIIGGRVYNFWRDAAHVRGIWRMTTVADFAKPSPAWKTVLDVDALAKSEGKNWYWAGANCEQPAQRRCLIELSDGGEDATTIREFDLTTRAFVPGGFVLPHSKQSATWEDRNHLLVAREWTPGDVTASSYPYILKRVTRGAPVDQAVEVFRGTKSDVSVGAQSFDDHRGHHAVILSRGVSFFESQQFVMTPSGPQRLNIPLKASAGPIVAGRLLISLDQAWAVNGTTIPAGDLTAVDLASAMADPAHLHPTIVYAPGPRETLEGATPTRDRLILNVYENVKGRASVMTPVAGGGWTKTAIPLPDNSSITTGAADRDGNAAFIYVSSFLTPNTLLLANAATGATHVVKTTAAKFDASRDVVEQHFATSSDGTKIPYFLVHPKTMAFDGTTPTILYGYGGFGVSLTPSYSANVGKLWLEHGGAYVVANIRGGGEFGPAWHDAGLKTHRQIIYDDFAAVARDLIATKVTSPRRLGIEGGSNGGLLMGVEFTQHPELFHAVDIEVPLLDMLGFEHIEAGASWVGEYGSVSIPAERDFLASISPYNNLKPGVMYPEPLIWTTTKDDRVGPEHARKFAAKLASMNVPYYFYEVTEGGHNSGANVKEQSFTEALSMTYFTRMLMDN